MSMFKLALIGLGLALLGLSACAEPEQAGHSLRVGVGLEPPHLDPTSSAAAAIDEVVYANVFEGLTRINRDGQVVPALAREWTLSDDGLTYRFDLQDNVRFHDGSEFDSSSVQFSMETARADGSTNPRPDIFAAIDTISIIDPYTVEFSLHHPTSSFLFNLAQGDAVMVSPASAASNTSQPVGTGPFQFTRWQKGQRIVLERFDGYWGTAPLLDQVEFLIIPDSAAAYAALLAGDVDGFANFPAPELIGQLSRDDRFQVIVGSTEGETVMGVNAQRAPFNDIRVRQALSHAIDRSAIIEGAMYGFGTPIGSFFSPLHPAYLDLTAQSDFDPERARELLAQAGYAEGFETELKLPPTAYARRSGEIIAAQLADIGIDVRLQYVEWASWLDEVLNRRAYQMTIVSHTEPADLSFFARDGNYFGYENATFAELLSQIETASDLETRTALYQSAQRQLADDAAAVFLFQLPQLGVWRSDITGVWPDAPIQAIDITEIEFAQTDEPAQ